MNIPTSLNSIAKRVRCNSEPSRPLGNAQGQSLQSHVAGSPSVLGLLPLGRPSDIAWFIVAVVVWVSIQTVCFAGTISDIREESVKRFSPTIAHDNPPGAIVSVRAALVIEASLQNRSPRPVLRRAFGPCLSVLCSGSGNNLTVEAPAALRQPTSEGVAPGNCNSSAIASAFPKTVAVIAPLVADNRESSEVLAGQINGLSAACRGGLSVGDVWHSSVIQKT
jgi:hypothetical protein